MKALLFLSFLFTLTAADAQIIEIDFDRINGDKDKAALQLAKDTIVPLETEYNLTCSGPFLKLYNDTNIGETKYTFISRCKQGEASKAVKIEVKIQDQKRRGVDLKVTEAKVTFTHISL